MQSLKASSSICVMHHIHNIWEYGTTQVYQISRKTWENGNLWNNSNSFLRSDHEPYAISGLGPPFKDGHTSVESDEHSRHPLSSRNQEQKGYIKTQLPCILLYYADDMFWPLWAIFRSQKCIYEGKSLNNRNFIITFLQEYLLKLFVSYFSK